jgi:hypothetical protein
MMHDLFYPANTVNQKLRKYRTSSKIALGNIPSQELFLVTTSILYKNAPEMGKYE